MVIADTSVWVDFLRGAQAPHCDRMALLMDDQTIALCDRVLQEVLQGVLNDREFRTLSTRLLALPCFNLGGHALALAPPRGGCRCVTFKYPSSQSTARLPPARARWRAGSPRNWVFTIWKAAPCTAWWRCHRSARAWPRTTSHAWPNWPPSSMHVFRAITSILKIKKLVPICAKKTAAGGRLPSPGGLACAPRCSSASAVSGCRRVWWPTGATWARWCSLDAVLKVFLTASVAARAQRRYKQLKEKGFDANLAALSRDLEARDAQDANRAVAPLKPARDAVELDSTDLSIEEVAARIVAWWLERKATIK